MAIPEPFTPICILLNFSRHPRRGSATPGPVLGSLRGKLRKFPRDLPSDIHLPRIDKAFSRNMTFNRSSFSVNHWPTALRCFFFKNKLFPSLCQRDEKIKVLMNLSLPSLDPIFRLTFHWRKVLWALSKSSSESFRLARWVMIFWNGKFHFICDKNFHSKLCRIIGKWLENVCTNGKNYTECRSTRFFRFSWEFNFQFPSSPWRAALSVALPPPARQFAEFKVIIVVQSCDVSERLSPNRRLIGSLLLINFKYHTSGDGMQMKCLLTQISAPNMAKWIFQNHFK